jgi:hypothetical protein
MAFEGGPLSVLGITPEFISTTGTVSAQTGAILGLGQVWQGAGQSFFGLAGQSLAGNLAGSAINIALNSAFGTNVPGPQGIPLDSGANILASVITPYVTGSVAAGINQQLEQSLLSAGPFGPLLASLGTTVVEQAFNGLSGSLLGATSTGTNYKMFPGGGDEPPADYGGSSYTLTDVVFSLQPANQGPQAFGDLSAAFSKSFTTLPFGDLLNADFGVDYEPINSLKQSVMQGNFLGDVVSTNTGLA